MAHSVELLFDAHTDAALRAVWDALTDAGIPSQARVRSSTNRPHVTVAVADHIAPAVDAGLQALAGRLPLRCVVGTPLVFGSSPKPPNRRESASGLHHFVDVGVAKSRGRFTLAKLVVPSAELLELQRLVHEICAPHMTPGPAAHSGPGHWTPHATLGRRLNAGQLGTALAAVPALTTELHAQFTALRRWDGDQRVEHVLIS